MLSIDGSIGEGGGQVLRTSLALAVITGKAFRMINIRRRRAKPGLMPQHLKAVEAASAVGMARVGGDRFGSQELVFEPTGIRAGQFHFDIGTAGATSLVLQTIVYPLSFGHADANLTLVGGTHVPWSPCFHYLQLHWLRYMEKIGFAIDLKLESAGFYPRGGGRIHATVHPVLKLSALQISDRGSLKRIRGISAVANLSTDVAERQKRQALRKLGELSKLAEFEILSIPALSPGTFLLLLAEFENSQCCFYGLGARGKPAERVADEAVNGFRDFMLTDGCIDHYLADQLVLPLALASGKSDVKASQITLHLTTNAEVVRMFLPVSIEIDGKIGEPGSVRISGGM
ncbi:MAG TPA: RNA 3'-terminal phosphate cyclase [Candidatus Acidoferrales bacterium]|nr:RNA 3'-terminal phosphate cyclase [Candidatus Acidoferrales bacterium]